MAMVVLDKCVINISTQHHLSRVRRRHLRHSRWGRHTLQGDFWGGATNSNGFWVMLWEIKITDRWSHWVELECMDGDHSEDTNNMSCDNCFCFWWVCS